MKVLRTGMRVSPAHCLSGRILDFVWWWMEMRMHLECNTKSGKHAANTNMSWHHVFHAASCQNVTSNNSHTEEACMTSCAPYWHVISMQKQTGSIHSTPECMLKFESKWACHQHAEGNRSHAQRTWYAVTHTCNIVLPQSLYMHMLCSCCHCPIAIMCAKNKQKSHETHEH